MTLIIKSRILSATTSFFFYSLPYVHRDRFFLNISNDHTIFSAPDILLND